MKTACALDCLYYKYVNMRVYIWKLIKNFLKARTIVSVISAAEILAKSSNAFTIQLYYTAST